MHLIIAKETKRWVSGNEWKRKENKVERHEWMKVSEREREKKQEKIQWRIWIINAWMTSRIMCKKIELLELSENAWKFN